MYFFFIGTGIIVYFVNTSFLAELFVHILTSVSVLIHPKSGRPCSVLIHVLPIFAI